MLIHISFYTETQHLPNVFDKSSATELIVLHYIFMISITMLLKTVKSRKYLETPVCV